MNRRSSVILVLCLSLLLSGCVSPKPLPLEEKLSILKTVRRYYYDLEMSNYQDALGYVLIPVEKKDASGFEITNKAHALQCLNRDLGYALELVSLHEEVFDYRGRDGLYTVTASLRIRQGETARMVEETLHLAKPLDHWKITEIESTDPFVPLRSNLYWFYADPQTE